MRPPVLPLRVAAVVAVVSMVSSVLLGTSSASAQPQPAVTNVEPPIVTGQAVFRRTLLADPGTWDPEDATVGYAWLRDGEPIGGATGERYRLRLDDIGHRIAVQVTATKEGHEPATIMSEPTLRVKRARFSLVARPTVEGTARFGRTLEATRGRWSPKPATVRYRWLRNGTAIRGATSPRYRLRPHDVGDRVAVAVTVRRHGYVRARARSRAVTVLHRVPLRRTVTYSVATRGRITANLTTFRRLAQQTYDDPRGWRGGGVAFRRVRSGGDFTLVLSQAELVPSFSSVCSSEYSCRVGRFVIINQTRWQRGTTTWSAAGRNLRDYRHMVVNHETGHWLGHGHRGCPAPGRRAPVMMQQSKGLHGCKANPWPLLSEL